MVKKKPSSTTGSSRSTRNQAADQVEAAESRMAEARAELERAREYYREVKDQAQAEAEKWKKMTVGEALDTALDCVRKHPAAGTIVAAACGFFLGRLFRR